MRLGVLVSGRGSNLQAILDASREGRIESRVAIVLSDVEDAPALDRARALGVPARYVDPGGPGARLSSASARRFVDALRAYDAELVLLAGFMRIVGRTFFEAFPGRMLNMHPSLLPAFRGLDPQRQALDAGVEVSGCTVHVVVPEVDAGPIVAQGSVPVFAGDTVEDLSARILREEHRVYVRAVRSFERGRVAIEGGRARVTPPD
jgi:phosphoribosylglycinamide formyltransferase-1